MDTWLPFVCQLIFSRLRPPLIKGCCFPKCNKVFFLHRKCLQLHLVNLSRIAKCFWGYYVFYFLLKFINQVIIIFLQLQIAFGSWHGRVDQFWHHRVPFLGVIANVISYYICWAWLIGTHFQIIYFNIYMVQIFVMQKP
jgi:hypothetical protein